MPLIDEREMRELVYGGAVLGAGGGGSIEAGLRAGYEALARGRPRLLRIEELPSKTVVVTLSIVGSVGQMEQGKLRMPHASAVRHLAEVSGKAIGALIPSEVGPQAVTYGWQESAEMGIPIADAPCNGRAHPLGLMGSLGLHRYPKYVTTTVVIGGSSAARTNVELMLQTTAQVASRIVRHAAETLGISLRVARNPLPASYVKKHAAVGGLTYAQNVGKIVLNEYKSGGLPALLERLSQSMGGHVLCHGRVTSAVKSETRGFTVGHIIIASRDGSDCRVSICNEYMSVERNGARLAVFPDLISVFDFESCLPLSSPAVKANCRVAVFGVPRGRLRLSSTMYDPALLAPIERFLKLRLRGPGMSETPPGAMVFDASVGGSP